jgi:hypothetical protein
LAGKEILYNKKRRRAHRCYIKKLDLVKPVGRAALKGRIETCNPKKQPDKTIA